MPIKKKAEEPVLNICEAMCDQCLFGPNKVVSEARKQELIAGCLKKDSYFECHKGTIAREKICCRGFYNTYKGNLIFRVAAYLGIMKFVPVPKPEED